MENKIEIEECVAKIQALAPTVGVEYDAQQAAISAERDAETAVLERAIELARPALRAISSRIQTGYRDNGGGRDGCHHVEGKEWSKERGLVLVDDLDRGTHGDGNSGWYGGDRLYLLADGSLARSKRKGSWSRWQGVGEEWEAPLTRVSVRSAMDEYELADCLKVISEALQAQVGKRDAKAPQARAERLAALVALLK